MSKEDPVCVSDQFQSVRDFFSSQNHYFLLGFKKLVMNIKTLESLQETQDVIISSWHIAKVSERPADT